MTARAWFDSLLRDCSLVELRVVNPRPRSVFVRNLDELRSVLRDMPAGASFYTTLNKPFVETVRGKPFAISDKHIERIVRLPFDFDPARPAACASTDAELAAALAVRDRFVAMLAARGWPVPALGMSGNGGHAVWWCWLPADEAWRQMREAIYAFCEGLFGATGSHGDAGVIFDTQVKNPSRIWRVYSTVNCKGTPTPKRPHRRATVVVPPGRERVPLKLIEALAVEAVRDADRRRRSAALNPSVRSTPASVGTKRYGGCNCDFSTLDIVRLFDDAGMGGQHREGNIHSVCCPWRHEHSDADAPFDPRTGDSIVYAPDGGAAGFFCQHAHCAGRRLGAVVEFFGPEHVARYCARGWPPDPARRTGQNGRYEAIAASAASEGAQGRKPYHGPENALGVEQGGGHE